MRRTGQWSNSADHYNPHQKDQQFSNFAHNKSFSVDTYYLFAKFFGPDK